MELDIKKEWDRVGNSIMKTIEGDIINECGQQNMKEKGNHQKGNVKTKP